MSGKCNGSALVISTGASAALRKKSDSLLPDGVIGVIGEFEPGDVVELRDTVGCVLGRGLVNYRSSDCEQLAGKSVEDIGPILGWRGCVLQLLLTFNRVHAATNAEPHHTEST